jgi:L-rhamnose-H+ transport protein
MLWQGLPALVVVLLGGFTTNFLWCLFLNIRNHSGYEYFSSYTRGPVADADAAPIIENPTDAPAEEMARASKSSSRFAADRNSLPFAVPMLSNYLFCALAGTTWYFQFFFYTMGETQMGRYKFSSWTLHMASIIIFSTLWGIALKEWDGAGLRTKIMVALSLATLVASTAVVGYGNYLATHS